MMLSAPSIGNVARNIAGMIAKYLATSLAIENVVNAPRVISSCLPISTISMSLVGLESRSTMLPASFAACVPVFIATPTSACASAGASLVPSPVIATSLPSACSRLMSAILSSGVAWARKSSTPASDAIAAAVSGLSPVIITVLIPIARRCAKRSRMPPFDDVLQVNDAERAAAFGDDERRAAASRDALDDAGELLGHRTAPGDHPLLDRFRRPLPDLANVAADVERHRRPPSPSRGAAISRSTPDMRVCAVNGTNVACCGDSSRPRSPYFSFASTTIDRPSGVSSGERRQLRRVGERRLADAGQRHELGGLAVAERDRPRLVEQQRVDVARRLRPPGPTSPARCAAPADPCRQCRSPTAGRRSSSG